MGIACEVQTVRCNSRGEVAVTNSCLGGTPRQYAATPISSLALPLSFILLLILLQLHLLFLLLLNMLLVLPLVLPIQVEGDESLPVLLVAIRVEQQAPLGG